MSNDLISRKALMECAEYDASFNLVIPYKKVLDAPTAYDVDAVYKELENATGSIHYTEDASFDGKCIEDFEFIQSKTAIEIVRNGGIK